MCARVCETYIDVTLSLAMLCTAVAFSMSLMRTSPLPPSAADATTAPVSELHARLVTLRRWPAMRAALFRPLRSHGESDTHKHT